MTDEQMDARLRRAGDAWRSAPDETVATAVREPVDVLPMIARVPKHRRWLVAASAAVIAGGLVAGGVFIFDNGGGHANNVAGTSALRGTVWRLVQIGNQPSRPNSLATFYIGADGRFVVDDSCEVTGGQASTSAGSLRLVPDDQRYRDCTDTAGELTFGGRAEQTMFGSSKYSVDDTGLTLTRAGKATLHFVAGSHLAVPTIDVPTFLGAKWKLVKATDAHGASQRVLDIALQVKDGRLVTSDGCNSITADVVDGRRIDTKSVTSTAIGCPIGSVVNAVVAVFGAPAIQVHVRGSTLTLSAAGAGQLSYQWVPDGPTAPVPTRLPGDWRLVSVAGAPAHGRVHLYLSPLTPHHPFSVTFGCGAVGGTATLSIGSMVTSGIPDGPAPGCQGELADQSSTVDSFLSANPVSWSIRGGKLMIFGGGAQAFSLVFVPGT